MTRYTVIDHDGYVIDSGLTLEEAANEIMRSDSREWELRKDEGFDGWTAWSRQQVANRPWSKTVFYSACPDENAARVDICKQIVGAERMRGHPEAMTDNGYAEMNAALHAELAEDAE
jgi:hypothetical protein